MLLAQNNKQGLGTDTINRIPKYSNKHGFKICVSGATREKTKSLMLPNILSGSSMVAKAPCARRRHAPVFFFLLLLVIARKRSDEAIPYGKRIATQSFFPDRLVSPPTEICYCRLHKCKGLFLFASLVISIRRRRREIFLFPPSASRYGSLLVGVPPTKVHYCRLLCSKGYW